MIRRALFWIGEALGALCVFAVPYALFLIAWAFAGG